MKTKQLMIVLVLVLFWLTACGDDGMQKTRVKQGQQAPDFTCQTISGEDFSLIAEKGNVILINFFATWCGPCMQEMPRLEKEIFQKFRNRSDFKLICIGREHNAEELEKFAEEEKLSLPIAPDPKREIYGKYAEGYIPRNFVIGKDGKIKWISIGYSEPDFQKLIQTIDKELGQQVLIE